jgi:glycosyltransferase involved in cell wall biosynthesis
MSLKISVIIATYNQPAWLEKVLLGYEQQRHAAFEVLIADDGSGPETAALIERYRQRGKLRLRHVWHEDRGFQKTAILNKAIVEAQYPYLLFTDGDCIPREDFLEVHARFAEPGYLLSGGYCKLPMGLSLAIGPADIRSQRCFEPRWLRANGLRGGSQLRKLRAKGRWAAFLDSITPTKATFNGCNASAWKTDVLAVNGFDERMRYGGLDRELGERLFNLGLRSKQIRHRAIVLHLDHARSYKTPEGLKDNLAIRQQTRREKIVRTAFGIEKS